MSLSLLIAGPSMAMLSEREKETKLDELEQMKTGVENVNERGLKQWAREGKFFLLALLVVIFLICCLIFFSLWVKSMDDGFLRTMLICLCILLVSVFGSGICLIVAFLSQTKWVPDILSPVILVK